MDSTWNDMSPELRDANTYLDCLVDEWHHAEHDPRPLQAALGMSWEEYKAWTENPSQVPERIVTKALRAEAERTKRKRFWWPVSL